MKTNITKIKSKIDNEIEMKKINTILINEEKVILDNKNTIVENKEIEIIEEKKEYGKNED